MQSRENITFTVDEHEDGLRLDRACASRHPGLSRNQIQIVNGLGGITVDGVSRPDSYQLSAGERVEIRAGDVRREGWNPEDVPGPEDIPVKIVYQDDDIVVVNKPAGLVVHPAHGNPGGTLVNALLGRGVTLAVLGSPQRPGIVHRLDKDTSGVMVVAKTPQAHERLVEMFQAHALERAYLAIALGRPPQSITFDTFHGRNPAHRKKFTSRTHRGRRAVTHLELVELLHGSALVRCRLETGRTHQIRVHLADHGYPVLGDPLYGKSIGDPALRRVSTELGRQALHAALLAFAHPITGEAMRFETVPPESFQRALEALRTG